MNLIYENLQIWMKGKTGNQSQLELLNIYGGYFIFEPVVTDDIRPVEDYYFPSDCITSTAPENLSRYNEEFK